MNDSTSTLPASTTVSEETFFTLRDSRVLFQRRLTEIVYLAAVVPTPALDAFSEALGKTHDELAASDQRNGFEQAHGLTASRITLMCDADLELEIRIGEISRRLIDIGGYPLWRAHLRYITLLRRPDMTLEDNPVGPEAICQGLWAICRTSGSGLEGNFSLLERIEEQFGLRLADMYNELNDLLASRNIEPTQTQITSNNKMRQTDAAQAAPKADPLSALQGILHRQLPGSESNSGGTANSNSALGAATLVMLNQLAARLDQLELSGPRHDASEMAPDSKGQPLPRTVKAKDLDLPLGKPEAIALDTLAHIFEAIFATWELPDTVKTAISRLQIPLLKLAIFDPSLFSDTTHSARRLINGMARASVGLPRNVSRAHPISTRLWQLAGTVAETLQGDPSVLAAPLAELDALIAERDRSLLAAAQPYLALLHEKERCEQARQAARDWLDAIQEQGAPSEILDFLRQHWVRVMAAASSKDNENNELWQENHSTIVELLWSVQSKQNPDDRKRLVALVPVLLKRISSGLDLIDTPPEQRAPFLDTCFTLQTAALRGNPAAPAAPTPQPLPTEDVVKTGVVVEIMEIGGKQLKSLTLASQTSAAYRKPMLNIPVGSWLQFEMNDSAPLCGLVCWQDAQSGDSLLFNRYWGHAIILSGAVLDEQLRNARAKVVSAQSIFEIAAERALSQLAGAPSDQ